MQAKFAYEPWTVTEDGFDPKSLRENESAFALANGFIGLRGNLEEGSATGAETIQGSFLNGVLTPNPSSTAKRPTATRRTTRPSATSWTPRA